MTSGRRNRAATAALVAAALLARPAWAGTPPPPDPRPAVEASAGVIGIFDDHREPLRLGLEYLGRPFSPLQLTWGAGVSIVEGGANFVFADLRKDFWLDDRWVVSVCFGTGLFHEGGGLHLGSEIEFRSGLSVSRQFGGRVRLGIGGYHLSNGGISDHNPGTEIAALLFAVPFGRARPDD